MSVTSRKIVRLSYKSHGRSVLYIFIRISCIFVFCVTIWGKIEPGGVKNRVKSGVRQTTHSERTAIAMENLIRYSETTENFIGSQFGSDFCLLNVFRVKLPVESGELAVFAWYSYHRHCDVNAPVQTSARVIITRNHSTNTTRQQFPLDLHTGLKCTPRIVVTSCWMTLNKELYYKWYTLMSCMSQEWR